MRNKKGVGQGGGLKLPEFVKGLRRSNEAVKDRLAINILRGNLNLGNHVTLASFTELISLPRRAFNLKQTKWHWVF